MRKRTFILASAIAAAILCAPRATFADGEPSYAKEFNVKFAGYQGSTTLTNFPALIRLSKARNNFDYSKCELTGGGDVRFFDAGGNLLPSEVDTWNPDGESLVWVSVPELNNHTTITVRYGNAAAPEVTPTDVWTNGYLAVWHMNASALTYGQIDSTINGHNLSTSSSYRNGMECRVEGAVGYAVELGQGGVKTGGYSVPDTKGILDGLSAITLETWTYQTAYVSEHRYIFNKQDPNVNQSAYYFQQLKDTNGKMAAYIYKTNSVGTQAAVGFWQGSSHAGVQLNEWTHQVFRWRGDTGLTTGFLNGDNVHELVAHNNYKGTGIVVGGSLYVGNFFQNQQMVFPGKIDEVRVSNVARSDDWVAATHDTIANDDFAVSEVPNDWTKYAHKFSVAFPGVEEGATLDDFPVLVKVSEAGIPGFHYADCVKEGGADLRFADANGTLLPCEVEVWNPDGESLIWVKIPTLTKDTRIRGYYGWNLAPAVDPTEVWDANYVGVWHMNAAEGTFTQKDSTATGKNVTAPSSYRDGILCGVDGIVGTAAELGRDGVMTGCFQAADGGTIHDGFPGITLEAWTFQTDYPSANAFLISKMAPSPWSVPYELYQRKTSGQLTGVLYTSANGYCDVWPGSGANPQLNEWAHQSFRWDGSTGIRTGFINGTSVVEKSSGSNVTGVGLHNASAPLTIGNEHYSKSTVFPGKIDEVRISKVARSDAWVKATYDTIAANATFTRYGTVGDNVTGSVIFFQ
ncbi:MAG: DUF2341 domain-containing protein [Kiritimatiellae bacterium]|nr:DUF2341 domain-containing protein [Kiritimatiellia bacterium]